jgi:hypothetical protein
MISYTIDADRKLVRVTVTGTLSVDDALLHQSRLKADPGFDPSFSQITIFVNVAQQALDAAGLRSIALNAPYQPGARRAFVLPNDFGIGLGRMFQAYSDGTAKGEVSIFRDEAEALAWVLRA